MSSFGFSGCELGKFCDNWLETIRLVGCILDETILELQEYIGLKAIVEVELEYIGNEIRFVSEADVCGSKCNLAIDSYWLQTVDVGTGIIFWWDKSRELWGYTLSKTEKFSHCSTIDADGDDISSRDIAERLVGSITEKVSYWPTVDLDVGLTDLGDNGGVIWIDSDWQIVDVGNIDWWDEGRTSWVDVDVGPTFSGDNGGVIWIDSDWQIVDVGKIDW